MFLSTWIRIVYCECGSGSGKLLFCSVQVDMTRVEDAKAKNEALGNSLATNYFVLLENDRYYLNKICNTPLHLIILQEYFLTNKLKLYKIDLFFKLFHVLYT